MELFEYTFEQGKKMACPFNGSFDDDMRVIFHGTLNNVDSQIETEGFKYKNLYYDRADVDAVMEVFEELLWCGTINDGYAVLATYTRSDFNRG